ncbi:general substrate transporter [Acaromyces ingoldii]|uniref:General substrate transporter n=1 Tax=Acaromyces ingoldii TaxID=215250 RepID=A0A316YP35_9BASI|nr:general substrate transporter [Acaromyces ingoldii]PWN91039.1 general substrate transporter [Acaromyces ingoldii]
MRHGLGTRPLNALVALPSFFVLGYSQSSLGGLVKFDDFKLHFPQCTDPTIQGITVSSYTLGAALGAFATFYLGNRLGRRRSAMLGATVAIVGLVLQASSFALAQLILGRVLVGLGVGIQSATVPVWQSELSIVSSKRGALVIFDGICLALGIASAAWVNLGFSFIGGRSALAWRLPSALPLVPMLVSLAASALVLESPRWLLSVHREERAREGIATLLNARSGATQVDEYARAEPSLWKLVRPDDGCPPRLRTRAALAVVTQAFQQLSGGGLISYYSGTLFSQLGFDATETRVLSATALTFKLVCTLIPFLLIERLGRRRLLIVSGAGMASVLVVLVITSAYSSARGAVYVSTACIYLFNLFLPIGFLGVNYLYCAEIAPQTYRAPISALSTGVHWCGNFIVAMVTPVGFASLSWGYYIIFTVIASAIVPTVYFFFPETSGLSLEEIDDFFAELRREHTPPSRVMGADDACDVELVGSSGGGDDVDAKVRSSSSSSSERVYASFPKV